MATKRKFAYFPRQAREYIFSKLLKYRDKLLPQLSPTELPLFETENTLRNHCINASSDQLEIEMVKAGVVYFGLFVDFNVEEPFELSNIKDVWKSFRSGKERQRMIDEMVDKGVFVIDDRNIIAGAHLMAQNANTPYYTATTKFQRTYEALQDVQIKGLKNRDKDPFIRDIKKNEDARDICINFYLACKRSTEYVKIKQNLEELDMLIMMTLMLNRDIWLDKTFLIKKTTTPPTPYPTD